MSVNGKDNAAQEQLAKASRMFDILLGPEGCPWDKKQTMHSLCEYALEEMYELVDSIRNGNVPNQREELGDVLFILMFMSKLAEKEGNFTLAEVLEENRLKMTGRHPHVFGNTEANDQQSISDNWEKIKRAEKERRKEKSGVFGSLPAGLTPLIKAYRIHSKSASNKFTWDTDEDAEQQVEAEWLEWLDACLEGDKDAQEHELGDLIFSIVELGRRKGIKANEALDKTNTRYLKRFAAMEALAAKRGLDFVELDQDAKDALWQEIKAAEDKADTQDETA